MNIRIGKSVVSLESQLEKTSSAPAALPEPVRLLAEELVGIHGSIKVATELHGLHLYLPCPECLKDPIDGMDEIFKKHLAFNVDKYFAGEQRCVLCMKCGFFCDGAALSFFPSLQDRGIAYTPEIIRFSSTTIREDYLERDAKGVMVPRNPGLTVPVHFLPSNHPGRLYLESRAYDPKALWDQFQCSWCEVENPNLFYRKQPGGFRITPQGRLIFFCLMNGSKLGWQARILEAEEWDLEGSTKFYWHPYQRQWVPVLTMEPGTSQWVAREGYEEWDPAKYWTGPGTRRGSVLMGFDAALKWNLDNGRNLLGDRVGILVEGPLDAGRLRPPAMGILGKTLGAEQSVLVRTYFHRVVVVQDNDAAGDLLMKSVSRNFSGQEVRFMDKRIPDTYKDPGKLEDAKARLFMQEAIAEADKL